jgi:hypothetical protein
VRTVALVKRTSQVAGMTEGYHLPPGGSGGLRRSVISRRS